MSEIMSGHVPVIHRGGPSESLAGPSLIKSFPVTTVRDALQSSLRKLELITAMVNQISTFKIEAVY